MKALPDLTLMAVLVEHMEGQRDLITHKSIWHLSDVAMKNVCEYYLQFILIFVTIITFKNLFLCKNDVIECDGIMAKLIFVRIH